MKRLFFYKEIFNIKVLKKNRTLKTPNMRFTFFIFLFLCGVVACNKSHAQTQNAQGKIILAGIIIDGDTIAHGYLPQVTIVDPTFLAMSDKEKRAYKERLERRREQLSRLRRNVYKTYPYAVMAGYVIHDIDSAMLKIRSKDAKRLYKAYKEKELMAQYKGELENLTMSQGETLVILIARQTGKDCYTIIKELKGGFNARIWQTMASLFSNNLKRSYDPDGKDADIELICREIEASGKFVRSE